MEKAYKPSFWERTVRAFSLAPPEEDYSEGPLQAYSEPVTTGTGIIPPPRSTTQVIGPRTALSINAVYRAVDIIKGSVSQLPLAVQRGGQDIDIPALISKPDVRTTQTQFLALTAHSLATHGNAYWRLHRAIEGPFEAVSNLEVLNPELIVIDWIKGRQVYRYGDTTFADWQVKHLMIFPSFEMTSSVVKGVGPIQANFVQLQAILEMEAYLKSFYANNGVPTGILTTEGYLADGEGAQLRADWYAVQAAGGLQIVPRGLTYQAIALDPEKAQFHASAQKAVVDIARMFGIPDRYLLAAVDGTSMTYTNMTDVDRQFIRYTLMSYLTAIEDAFTELLPRGQRAKFNLDAFFRGSTKERYDAHKIALDAGFMTKDEVRAFEDLPPLNEGDSPTT